LQTVQTNRKDSTTSVYCIQRAAGPSMGIGWGTEYNEDLD